MAMTHTNRLTAPLSQRRNPIRRKARSQSINVLMDQTEKVELIARSLTKQKAKVMEKVKRKMKMTILITMRRLTERRTSKRKSSTAMIIMIMITMEQKLMMLMGQTRNKGRMKI